MSTWTTVAGTIVGLHCQCRDLAPTDNVIGTNYRMRRNTSHPQDLSKGKAKKNQQTCLFSLNLTFNFSFEKLFQINTYTHT